MGADDDAIDANFEDKAERKRCIEQKKAPLNHPATKWFLKRATFDDLKRGVGPNTGAKQQNVKGPLGAAGKLTRKVKDKVGSILPGGSPNGRSNNNKNLFTNAPPSLDIGQSLKDASTAAEPLLNAGRVAAAGAVGAATAWLAKQGVGKGGLSPY